MSNREEGFKCLSMHQPWASLLVHGIKRIEGRDWNTHYRGRLWIHSTSKHPKDTDIKEVESFYKQIYEIEGKSVEFPSNYPTGVLLGSVEVVDCLPARVVENWDDLPDAVKLEIGSQFCFLCENPKKLIVPQKMRGWPGLWGLPKQQAKNLTPALTNPKGGDSNFTWMQFNVPKLEAGNLPPSAKESDWKNKYAK